MSATEERTKALVQMFKEAREKTLAVMQLLYKTHTDLRIDYIALKSCVLVAKEGLKKSGMGDENIDALDKIAEIIFKEAMGEQPK
jgi:hypothetical protein